MEALVAVGLAANVVQFVQFSSQLIAETARIRHSKDPSTLPNLRNLSQSSITQAETIYKCLKSKSATLTEEDQYLVEAALECRKAGKDFLGYLDSLIESNISSETHSKAPKSLKAIRTSFKYLLSRDRIDAFVSKLEDLRSTLLLATTLALRASTNSNNDEILAQLKELRVDKDKEEILKISKLLASALQTGAEPKLDKINLQVNKCLEKIDSLREDTPGICSREKVILRWLDFRQMTWRYDEVPLAYQKTYQWVFEEPSADQHWNNFKAHLSQGNDAPYFVNGKAGSGKSTLMKFIVGHPETQMALARWTGERHSLLVLKFFFWHLGTPLQKNVKGLLRAFLHTALAAYPELIPAVFPRHFQAWHGGIIGEEASYVELKQAFDLLVIKSVKFLKTCIFIDGLDEFESDREGNLRDVAEWLCSLARQHEHVTVVVSSRPLTPCISTFRGSPNLKLQELTKCDMEAFIRGNLDSHQDMFRLAKRFPQQASELVSEINDRAEGVFLWVRIAVRLLIDGLEAGDDFQDLQEKLRSLPPDIRDLYQRMFVKMEPEYRLQAAKIFQLIQAWKCTTTDPFTTTILFFALRDPSKVRRAQHEPADAATLELFYGRTEALIRSRCCGLLEVHKKNTALSFGYTWIKSSPNGLDEEHVIEYLHRTVAEFLAAREISDELCKITGSLGFDPYLSLFSSLLSLAKAGAHSKSACDNMTAFLRKASKLSPRTLKQCLDALDKEYTYGDPDPANTTSRWTSGSHWSAQLYEVNEKVCRASYGKRLQDSATLSTFAARQGLARYLETFYSLPNLVRPLDRAAPILYALESWPLSRDEPIQRKVSLKDQRDTLLFLLHNCLSEFNSQLEIECIRLAQEAVNKKLAENIVTYDEGLEAYAVFVAIFLTTTRSPETFIPLFRGSGQGCALYPETLLTKEKKGDESPNSMFFLEISSILQQSEDSQNRLLGLQVEQITRKFHIFLQHSSNSLPIDKKLEELAQRADCLTIEKEELVSESLKALDFLRQETSQRVLLVSQRDDLVDIRHKLKDEVESTQRHLHTAREMYRTLAPLERLAQLEDSHGTEEKDKHFKLSGQNESTMQCVLSRWVTKLTSERDKLRWAKDRLIWKVESDLKWVVVESSFCLLQ